MNNLMRTKVKARLHIIGSFVLHNTPFQSECANAHHWNSGDKFPAPGSMLRSLVLPVMLCTSLFAGGIEKSRAQYEDGGVINREYAIKAAYLYQFGNYIQWPADAFADNKSPFIIGILGNNPFGGALDEIAREKKIDGRRIVIRRFASLDDYMPCHILFVASSSGAIDRLSSIQKMQDFPVLLVGESPGFAQHGGTINLFIEQNRIRFEINMEVAKREQLKISSKLLSLAKIVESPLPNL